MTAQPGLNLSVVGKGGVGKTTVSAAIALALNRRGHEVFAVDGDPNNCLGYALGFPDRDLGDLRPLSEMRDELEERASPGGGGMYLLKPPVADLIEQYSLSQNGLRLLVMGSIGQAGAGCACGINASLRQILRELVRREEAIVVDMEAGIEHLGRATTDALDTMLVVAEPRESSIRTCQRIVRLADQMGVGRVATIANKARGEDDIETVQSGLEETPVIAAVPYLPDLREPLTATSPAVEQLLSILDQALDELCGTH